MGIKVDLTNVETLSFKPLPKGKYLVKVDDYKEKVTSAAAKNPGCPLISWKLVVEEGEFEGRTLWDNMPIIPPNGDSKGTLWRVKQFLEACGFETSEEELDLDPADVLGSTLWVRVAVKPGDVNEETGEEYEARNEVKAFTPVEAAE